MCENVFFNTLRVSNGAVMDTGSTSDLVYELLGFLAGDRASLTPQKRVLEG